MGPAWLEGGGFGLAAQRRPGEGENGVVGAAGEPDEVEMDGQRLNLGTWTYMSNYLVQKRRDVEKCQEPFRWATRSSGRNRWTRWRGNWASIIPANYATRARRP